MKNKNNAATNRVYELLKALTEGVYSSALQTQIRDWLLDIPEGGKAEEALARWATQHLKAKTTPPTEEERKSFIRLAIRLGFSPENEVRRANSPGNGRAIASRWGVVMRLAAVFIPVAIAVGIALFLPVDKEVVLALAEGESRTIVLPDSTLVTVMERSTLKWSKDFASGRDVELDGEAYFKVAHDGGNPFTVYHDDIKVEVTGTEFNIKARSTSEVVEVVLAQGSIVLETGNNRREMVPGEKASVDKTSETIEFTEVNAGEMMRLRGEELSIGETSFGEAVRMVADYFEKELVIQQGIHLDDRINLILPQGVGLESILTYINRLSDFAECRLEGDNIVITSK